LYAFISPLRPTCSAHLILPRLIHAHSEQ
jgi:hypothetical protein